VRILATDNLKKEGVELLQKAGFDVEATGKLSPEELKEKIKGVDVLIVRSGTKVTQEVIEASDKLKIIGRAGVGVDNIDIPSATRKGIVVMNAPTGNTVSAAEHAIALLLALARNIPWAHASLIKGEWDRKRFMGTEVYGKTLGIIGLGRVGTHVAKCALGLGMKVLGYDPFISREAAERIGVKMVEFDELLSLSDFITLHVPLTPHTRHLIGEKEFQKMKKGVRIINSARGGVIDEEALYNAIKEGIVKGAALDVFEEEPPKDCPLIGLPEVIVTPHLGASTLEAQFNVAVEIASQIVDALKKGIYRNALNLPAIPTGEWKEISPYLQLSEKLGTFLGELCEKTVKEISVEFLGDLGVSQYSILVSAVLKGMLSVILPGSITYVNARMLAEERGIKVMERESKRGEDFTSAIRVKVVEEKGEREVTGALFERKIPRIVSIDGFGVEVEPEGNILLCYGLDKPGLIGKIGKILGDKGINIARMTFSRKRKGGEAITVLNVDSPVSERIREEIEKLEDIDKAEVIVL